MGQKVYYCHFFKLHLKQGCEILSEELLNLACEGIFDRFSVAGLGEAGAAGLLVIHVEALADFPHGEHHLVGRDERLDAAQCHSGGQW